MAGPIRHPIPVGSLTDYLRNNVAEINLPLIIQQFGYGQSNPTYLLTSSNTGAKYVLRKKPPGKLLSKTAHQVEREYRVLKALSEVARDLPVPKVYCLCEDADVVGSAFYIMEFLDGRIFEDAALPGVTPEERAVMWKSAIVTLARLHKIRPEEYAALKGFGKPSDFYGRQVRTLSTIEAAQALTKDVETGVEVGKIPRFDEAMKFFSTTQPKDRSTVIHGDYKIDNLVFHRTEPRVIGILDWELSTIGHPLSDFRANLLSPYQLALETGASAMSVETRDFLPGATPGLPPRQQVIDWYGQASGWNILPSEMYWGDAFGFCRNSVIAQGIAARAARRQASSAKAGAYAERAPGLVVIAWRNKVPDEAESAVKGAAGSGSSRGDFSVLVRDASQLLTLLLEGVHRSIHPWELRGISRFLDRVSGEQFASRDENRVLPAKNPYPISVAHTSRPTTPPGFEGFGRSDRVNIAVKFEFVLLDFGSSSWAIWVVNEACREHDSRIRAKYHHAQGIYRGKYKVWANETICAVTGKGVGQPVKVRTPFTHSKTWRGVIPEWVDALRGCGKLAFNATTALQLYVGIQRSFETHEIRRICKGVIVFEEEIDKIHDRARVPAREDRHSCYRTCRYNDTFKHMTTLEALSHLDSQPFISELVYCINPIQDYSHKYNFRGLSRHQNIEFRQAGATDDPVEILRWIDTVTKFVEACMNTRGEEYVRMAGPGGITGDDLVRFGIRPAPIARPGLAAERSGHAEDVGRVLILAVMKELEEALSSRTKGGPATLEK
ncbi:unnamed protein product [Tuber aestivum]|uniref:Aminoglycoside phosphotransferase domain-containing protein n=1 Tax=Tuber aestivum TaxID=59557 RepID=A0A292PY41_9PEZI|nr:unnamed protein product [Tuber aestivum]